MYIVRSWINLIDHIMQQYFVDINFGKSCSKTEIWFMFNCQTKRTIVALHLSRNSTMSGFFLGPEIEYLFVYAIAQSRTIAVFYHTICLPKPAQFSFFSCTLSEGLYIDYSERMSFEKQRTITKQQIRYFKDNQEVTRNLKLINYKLHSLQEQ